MILNGSLFGNGFGKMRSTTRGLGWLVTSKRHKVGQFLTHATQKRSEFVCYFLKKNAPQKAVRGLDVLEEINMNTNEG